MQDRQVCFVLHHVGLFKHRSVHDTIGFALELHGWKKAAIRRRVDALLLGQLQNYSSRLPPSSQAASACGCYWPGPFEQVGIVSATEELPATPCVIHLVGALDVLPSEPHSLSNTDL